MSKRKFTPPLNPATRDALGMVVACWAELETAVEYLMWGLLETEFKRARAVTTDLRILTRLDMLVLLAKEHFSDADKVANVLNLVKRAEELRLDRNHLVHARWEGSSCYRKHSAKRRWKVEEFPTSPQAMIQTARSIAELTDDFYGFTFENDLHIVPPWGPEPTS